MKWRMTEPAPREGEWLYVEAARQRQVTKFLTQTIETVRANATSAYERPGYRMIETRILGVTETLADARAMMDERVEEEKP